MTAWITAIVAIVALGVLLDIVMPEGEINKYIKGIFSIVTVVAIVAPIPALLGGNSNGGGYFDNLDNYTVDSNFVESVDAERRRQAEERLDALLSGAGFEAAESDIEFKDGIEIAKINVNVKNLGIKDDAEHKDIIDKIKKLVATAFAVKKENVNVYGYQKSAS